MILMVCGVGRATCSTPCTCRWRWKLSSSGSSIYPQPQQLELEQHALAICRSSGHSGNVVGRTSIIRISTDSSGSLLGLKPSSHPPFASASRTQFGSITTTIAISAAVAVSVAILMLSVMSSKSDAVELVASSSKQSSPLASEETLLDIPQELSSQDGGYCSSSASNKEQDCKKKPRIQRPKSRKAESCTIKCVTTCIRGGGGSPGEGPLNIRRPLVVFKEGFRSRQYCLIECSDICNLIGDGDSGP